MESSSNQIQESITQFPIEIKSGEISPVSLTNLENQTPPPSQLLQSGFSTHSPQLRYALSRKQPRIRVSPPSSRSFPPPPPETLASIAEGTYNIVPSKWCQFSKVWSRDLYLSRNSLLKKMIHQRILFRTLLPIIQPNVDEDDDTDGVEILGSPVDYWVTMPIIHPPIDGDIPELYGVSFNETEDISLAFSIKPMKPSRYGLNRLVGLGREPDNDGRPFQWVRNTTGTKFLDRDSIISLDIERIHGFVKCGNCGGILCVGYLLPTRIDMIDLDLSGKIIRYGDKLVRNSQVGCACGHSNPIDGKMFPGRHIISDDLNKINWMFLFLGYGIGHCTTEQLKYYCKQRNLAISDKRNKILATVYDDLCLQITN